MPPHALRPQQKLNLKFERTSQHVNVLKAGAFYEQHGFALARPHQARPARAPPAPPPPMSRPQSLPTLFATAPPPRSRVVENKHSGRDRSMTHLLVESSSHTERILLRRRLEHDLPSGWMLIRTRGIGLSEHNVASVECLIPMNPCLGQQPAPLLGRQFHGSDILQLLVDKEDD